MRTMPKIYWATKRRKVFGSFGVEALADLGFRSQTSINHVTTAKIDPSILLAYEELDWVDMDSSVGTYAVMLQAEQVQQIAIGRFGTLAIQLGVYVYIGSAFGPGGLAVRVGRHWRGSAVRRWHIDYLRAVTQPIEAWITADSIPREHVWAEVMRAMPGVSVPMAGFGASDCNCLAHLFYFAAAPSLLGFQRRYTTHAKAIQPVSRWQPPSGSAY